MKLTIITTVKLL